MIEAARSVRRMAYNQPKSSPHVLMFPWYAFGHITPYVHLANRLAERGFKISFLLPNKAKPIVQPLNLHPSLITFHSVSVPHVDGLPPGTETASDIPFPITPFLVTAMDLARPQVEQAILDLKPDFVFYDSAYWVPEVTSRLGIKSVCYYVLSAASLAIALVPACSERFRRDRPVPPTVEELASPPPGYPSSVVLLNQHEAGGMRMMFEEYGSGITFFERVNRSLKSGDVIAIRTCREMEGKICDYVSTQFQKPVLLTGPVLPETAAARAIDLASLEERWATWLGGHEPASVVYCCIGTEFILDKDQFQEVLLGFELAGYPFFAALRPPWGCSTVEEAMPEGYEERVKGTGVVYGGWVQQPLFLKHPSVGGFVTHCGPGSMWESLLSRPQIMLLPKLPDQILNTRMMAGELKVAVEVAKDETGWVSKESLCRAVKEAMDKESEVGCLIRDNHAKWREALGNHHSTLGADYVDSFVKKLSEMI